MSFSHSTVVLLDERLGAVLPSAALPALRTATAVYAAPTVPAEIVQHAEARHAPDAESVRADASRAPIALLDTDADSPHSRELLDAGARTVNAAAPTGVELLEAVAVMDRLRSPGGCTWDAEQSHESLRTYLIEETYELLEAIEAGDHDALREELGDVLLQVLFHARIAAERGNTGEIGFDIDAVAAELAGKMISRHPHVFADEESELSVTPDALDRRWEERKRSEKQRDSAMDGVATGQPAAALAAKVTARAIRAGIPRELLPSADGIGQRLFDLAAECKLSGGDPEDELRKVALRFAEQVRTAESSARAHGHLPTRLTPAQWRDYWS